MKSQGHWLARRGLSSKNWYYEFFGRPLVKIKRLIIIEFARMLGKAVKFRHCPATVSAPASEPVVSGDGRRQEFSQGCFA
jgi:hypothetical protein